MKTPEKQPPTENVGNRMPITKEIIKKSLTDMGLVCGDTVMVHSSLSSMGYVRGGADAVLDAFLETLLPEGTLVHAAFWGLYKQYMPAKERSATWDIEKSPSTVGVISETFRQRTGCLRSDNAQSSVAAMGKKAGEIISGHKTAVPRYSLWGDKCFGVGCPWDKFHEWDIKYLFLGCDHAANPMLEYIQTIYHNDCLIKEDSEAPWPNFNKMLMGRKLEREGLVQFGRIGEAAVRMMSPRRVQAACIRWLEEDPMEFFSDSPSIDNKFTKWHKQKRKRFREHLLQSAVAGKITKYS